MRSIVVEGECRKRYNRLNDCIHITKDVDGAHPKYPEPVLFHKPISQIVSYRCSSPAMRLAIHFNSQALIETAKIDDI
ncbi:hypothetical protein GCM10023219_12450 [Stakelama sediminis]|uniref:Uncharacterized protein n=1 Tax=Stakelama sediminis TaxID=463200 RepID=A0A840YWN8_9SPHN|nr:hypothetical protein [Stakelama sediminis]